MSDDVLRSIDDAIELLKGELGEDLTENRFYIDLDASPDLSYNGIKASLGHDIQGCELYKGGKYFGVLVVDIDNIYKRLNSASFLSVPTNKTEFSAFTGINILEERTDENPDVPYGRVDSHDEIFLGVSSEADKVKSGLSAVFIPRYKD